MRLPIFLITLLACSLSGYAQQSWEERIVIGVPPFTSINETPYSSIVTEKVVEIITNTKRFIVVDRTSRDKVMGELELQKSESFLDSKNTAKQGVAVGAERIIAGEINKIPILAIKNSAGGVSGYKCNVSFQMKVIDVESGINSEAVSFYGKTSGLMLTPESAVTEVMQGMQAQIEEYMRRNFPVKASLNRVLVESKGRAQSVLISAGKAQGIRAGDKFIVAKLDMVGGKPYPVKLGEVEVKQLAGEAFSECVVGKAYGEAISNAFKESGDLYCELIIE